MLTYFLLWFPMLIIAIANGLLRELIIKKWVTDIAAHQLSTLTLIVFFTFYIGLAIKKYTPSSATQSIYVGLFWMFLTLAFEFGFGRWQGKSWSVLFEDYNLLEGRFWIFIPLWLGIAPFIFYKSCS